MKWIQSVEFSNPAAICKNEELPVDSIQARLKTVAEIILSLVSVSGLRLTKALRECSIPFDSVPITTARLLWNNMLLSRNQSSVHRRNEVRQFLPYKSQRQVRHVALSHSVLTTVLPSTQL